MFYPHTWARKDFAHETHFWIIPRDDPFRSRIRIWYQVPAEYVTVRPAEAFDLNSQSFRRIDFFGSRMATAP